MPLTAPIIFLSTLFNRLGQQDELQERHFVRRSRQQPCINNIYIFPRIWCFFYFCSSNYSRLVSVSYESSCSRSIKMPFTISLVCMQTTWMLFRKANCRKPQQWRTWNALWHPCYLTSSALSVYIRKILKLKIIFSRILHKCLGLCSSLNL